MHQCVHCGKLYENVSNEIIQGCTCGSHFFFFIKSQQYEKLKEEKASAIDNLTEQDKVRIEKDVREMIGIKEEEPVILDFESISVIEPGKFHIDIVSLFDKRKPLVYKLEEGKYIIDLASTLQSKKVR